MAPSDPRPGQPSVYQIRLKGHLEDRWADQYEGLAMTLEETGNTLVTVPVVDQAVLHGLLRRMRDLGVTLVSINLAGSTPPGNSSKKEKEEGR